MKTIMQRLYELEPAELEKLKTFIESLLHVKKELHDLAEGRVVKLQQGKKQPIAMLNTSKDMVQQFTGFNACAKYINEQLGEKNAQNKLRKALNDGTSIQSYTFVLCPRSS